MKSRAAKRLVGVMVSSGWALCTPALATQVSYAIDPAQSTLSLSGSWIGASLSGRPADSLVTSYRGSIDADLTETSIQLLSADLDADNGRRCRPHADGRGGRQFADYGGSLRVGLDGVRGNLYVAFRDILLDLASGSMPLSGGAFDPTPVTVTAESGIMDYAGVGRLRPIVGDGRTPILGNGIGNGSLPPGALATEDAVQTLTLPIDAGFMATLESPWLSDPYRAVNLTLSGTIVATRHVSDSDGHDPPDIPEPATLGFLALGGGLACLTRRRAPARSIC